MSFVDHGQMAWMGLAHELKKRLRNVVILINGVWTLSEPMPESLVQIILFS
jgi:hypothetical protein